MDDQMGFDIEFDDKTQAFLEWVAPERMEAQIRAFLIETIPGTADYVDEWWQPPLTVRVLEATKQFFGGRDGFLEPENRDAADQFIRFYGECFVRRGGMAWTNRPEWSSAPLYVDFSPAVHDGTGDESRSIFAMTDYLFLEDDGPEMADYVITSAARDIRKARKGM
ncbi:hypothetical protein NONI108955_08795 [Nocardia ninae]|uniref:Uncharacterized protein n=1 Tax=Nocardia ninae NBRC 108245 TaxID=1210091 RepID=A0A511MJM8_9NOCA|nr:hypothetical protein [Nocardia ninae]GEM40833.1 hypothetical protein NN4_53520 [Nocardia ninae NBRC 108245]